MHRRRPAQNEAAARAAGQLTEHLSKLKPEDLPPVHVVAYKGATKFVKAYPVTSVLYILGLGLMCFASGLMPSEEAADEYSRLLQEADYETSILETAELKVAKQNARYQNTRGFLGFSCDTACNREYQTLQRYQQEHKEAKAAQFKALSQAKGKVGVFSMFAVQEARDLFWGSMGQGKAFAKRASMWDLLFMGLGSIGRDEGMVAFAFRLALNVLMNFTMGLIGATVAFIWFLWDVIRAYQPDPVTAVLAFSLFTIAAISMVATYLMTLYGAVGASAYMIVRQCALSIDNGQGKDSRVRSCPLVCVCTCGCMRLFMDVFCMDTFTPRNKICSVLIHAYLCFCPCAPPCDVPFTAVGVVTLWCDPSVWFVRWRRTARPGRTHWAR